MELTKDNLNIKQSVFFLDRLVGNKKKNIILKGFFKETGLKKK